MAVPKHRKGGDYRHMLDRIQTSLSNGRAEKLFDDDYFIFELIKLLYEETLEIHLKVQVLTVIEQHGSGVLPLNSVDQAVTALLDVFKELDTSPGSAAVGIQLLLTVTTIFTENEEQLMETELCSTYVSLLMDILAKLNNIYTRRIRTCCCQCLIQMEMWKPGLLWKRRDILAKWVKDEKTDVCQDYMQLLITVTSNALNSVQDSNGGEKINKARSSQSEAAIGDVDGKDILPAVSLIMDNVFLMTPVGLTTVTCSVTRLVRSFRNIPPNIFKPMILQCLPSMDPSVICLLLIIQREFRGEVLSTSEERLLVKQAIDAASHPNFGPYTRLLIAEWLLSFVQEVKLEPVIGELKRNVAPVVFDPLDVHTRKLAFLIVTTQLKEPYDLEKSLHYLSQLAETTGGVRVSRALYHILYLLVAHCNSSAVESYVLKITRKLFQSFPHLIPLIVDFLRAVKTFQPQCKLHSEILSLLHHTVLSLPINNLLHNYHNYLPVWTLSAQDSSILQQKPLRRMLDIVKEAVVKAMDDWSLGCMVLSICRTMMLHHHTDILYAPMGDLLYFLMTDYGDVDIKDQTRLYYTLLTLNSDAKTKEILGISVLDGLYLGENIAEFFPGSVINTVPAEIHCLETSPIFWNREHLEVQYEEMPDKMDHSVSLPARDGLEAYWDQLLSMKTSLKCTMNASILRESDQDNMVAVSFCGAESKIIQLGEDVHLPFLSKKAPSAVVYTAVPKVPEPVSIDVKAVFGHGKETFECELLPLTFELSDFLIPFPWHMFADSVSDKQQFFISLWTNYTENSQDRGTGVESVKILKCSQQSLLEQWENALACPAQDHSRDTDDYLFFLPPRFHLLFRVKARTTDVVVHIASDYWPVLGYLDHYLDNLILANP